MVEGGGLGGGRVGLRLRFLGGKVRIQPRQGGSRSNWRTGSGRRRETQALDWRWRPRAKMDITASAGRAVGGKGAEAAATTVLTQCNEEGKYAKKDWVMGEGGEGGSHSASKSEGSLKRPFCQPESRRSPPRLAGSKKESCRVPKVVQGTRRGGGAEVARKWDSTSNCRRAPPLKIPPPLADGG